MQKLWHWFRKTMILDRPVVRRMIIGLLTDLIWAETPTSIVDYVLAEMFKRNVILNGGERYDPLLSSFFYWDDCHLARYEFATQFITPEMTVLDIACGVGYGTALLGGAGAQCVGVDISPRSVQMAKVVYARPNVRFVQADFWQNTFTADAVTSFETLEHLSAYNFSDALDKLASFSQKVLIGSFPYKEPAGNNRHHVAFNLSELHLKPLFTTGNLKVFYQSPEGKISENLPLHTQNLIFVLNKF